MADMEAFAGDPVPLEAQGLLVRVTGLVLEAAGIRVPVGSVCEVRMPGQPPVIAEVVGFSGDCAFLMPTSDVARPGERRAGRAARDAGGRDEARRGAPPVAPPPRPHAAPAGRRRPARPRRRLARRADGPQGPDRRGPQRTAGAPPDQRDGPRPGAPAARHRRARDQRDADRRPRPAHRPVRRHRRRQVGAARHDGALHRRRRDRRRPDRRARPRGQGIHRGHPRRGRHPARRRRRRAGRRAARWCACRARTTRP